MEDSEPKNRGPRACVTCAKAKARCIPGPSATRCERCHRLNKPCGNQTPAPPRAKKVQKTTRVAELEKRLDHLASQLNSPGTAASGSTPRYRGSVSHDFNHLFPSDGSGPPEFVTPDTSPSGVAESPAPGAPSVSIWPSDAEAEKMLEEYRKTKARLVPFVIIPPMSAAELRVQRPFLWKGIMVVERWLDGTGQVTAGKELLMEISRATFVEPVKSLDVLHALQLAIAWLHYCLNGFQLTNALFLCRSLCVALRLTKDAAGPHDSTALERMRAFAGCYFLNTLIFTTEKLPDALMNTTYLDTCCNVLEAKMEYDSDVDLVQLVRIQKLAQSIAVTWDVNSPSLPSTHLPPTMIIQAFQEQIDSFRAALPPRLQETDSMNGRIHIAEILLYEIALHETSSLTQPERLSLLWRCLQSVVAYMRVRFAESDIWRPKFICLKAADFVFAAQVGLRLYSLRTPGWDLQLVRESLGIDRWIVEQSAELERILEARSQGPWTKAMQAAGMSPAMVDPFQKLLISLRGFSTLVSRENEKNVPITPPGDAAGVPAQEQAQGQAQAQAQDEGFMAGMEAEMSLFDDFYLTQLDFMAMGAPAPPAPPWEY